MAQEAKFIIRARDIINNNPVGDKIYDSLVQKAKSITKNDNNFNIQLGQKVKQDGIIYENEINAIMHQILINKHNHINTTYNGNIAQRYSNIMKNHASLVEKSQVKSIYSSTIKFQTSINEAIKQRIVTTFVVEGKDNTPYVFNPKIDDLSNMTVDETGSIRYNFNFSQKKLENNILQGQVKKLIDIAKTQAQRELIKEYQRILQEIEKVSGINQGSDYSWLYVDGKRRKILYQDSPGLNKICSMLNINQDQLFKRKELQISSDTQILRKGKKAISFEKLIPFLQPQYQIEYQTLNNLHSLQQQKINSASKKGGFIFHWRDMTILTGQRGDIREAFYGAFFGLQINHKSSSNFLEHLFAVDSESGVLTGDYTLNDLEIQIKSGNSSFNVTQFLFIANELKKVKEDNVILFLLTLKHTAHQAASSGRSKIITNINSQVQKKAK